MKASLPILLVVDDEEASAQVIKHMLGAEYEVLISTRVSHAFEIMEERDIHVVLSDNRMPDMSGVDFLSIVKNRYPDSVRVLFSGYADTQSAIEATNSGQVYCYIVKPCSMQDLRLMIGQAVGHYELARDRRELMLQLKEANKKLEGRNRELETANQKLQELDRLKTVFMEVVSHELNTPVSILRGYTFLLERGEGVEITSQAIEGIKSSTMRLSNISQKIFTVLKSKQPGVLMEKARFSIEGVCDGVHATVAPFLEKRRQELALECPPDLFATIDERMITDAVNNLVMNAIKFSPDESVIRIKASVDQGWVTISVIDNGIGVSAGDLPRIFQSFFGTFDSRHHSSGDFGFKKRGMGVGLTIARTFVQLHGGQISAVTKSGGGSTVAIHFPA